MEGGRISKKIQKNRGLFCCVRSLSPTGGGYICEGGERGGKGEEGKGGK